MASKEKMLLSRTMMIGSDKKYPRGANDVGGRVVGRTQQLWIVPDETIEYVESQRFTPTWIGGPNTAKTWCNL